MSKPKDIRRWTSQNLIEDLPPVDASLEKIADHQLIVLAEYSRRNTEYQSKYTYDGAIRDKILPGLLRRLREMQDKDIVCQVCNKSMDNICHRCA